jgi:hypothetical protein
MRIRRNIEVSINKVPKDSSQKAFLADQTPDAEPRTDDTSFEEAKIQALKTATFVGCTLASVLVINHVLKTWE